MSRSWFDPGAPSSTSCEVSSRLAPGSLARIRIDYRAGRAKSEYVPKAQTVSPEVALRTFYRFSAMSNQDVKLSKLVGMVVGECWW